MRTRKIDEYTLEVIEEIPARENVRTYDYNFLLAQKKAIETDLEKFIAARQAELKEIDTLITECEKAGIKPKEEKEII